MIPIPNSILKAEAAHDTSPGMMKEFVFNKKSGTGNASNTDAQADKIESQSHVNSD